MSAQTIDHTSFTHLLRSGAVRAVAVIYLPGLGGGWALSARYGQIDAAVTARRSGQLRTWARLGSVADHLHRLGVVHFTVDASQYQIGAARRPRPDRAEAMRKVHEQARAAVE